MVEIQEEDRTSSSNNNDTESSNPRVTLSEYLSTRHIECLLNGARALTLFFTVCYLSPIPLVVAPGSAYYKAFAAGVATSAIRLHQRIGRFALTREFFMNLLMEDSCHYLFYSALFLTSSTITMALLPIVLYATLNFANFILLVSTGYQRLRLTTLLGKFIHSQTSNILGIIACAEIFLVPLIISLVFVGQGSLVLPFVYYRFLTMRYASRRNPYTRSAFSQMKHSLLQISHSPSCPQLVGRLITMSTNFISNLAPVTV
ncbi:unnamed protein product [Auanema sp. JU1783]|nr:unnamed protein product [Auanema sp. JU1783]